jgi:glutaredoxin 2
LSDSEPYIIDGGIIRYKWNEDDPYIYYVCDEKELEQIQWSKDDIDWFTGETRKAYEVYKSTSETIFEGELKISAKLIERLAKYDN